MEGTSSGACTGVPVSREASSSVRVPAAHSSIPYCLFYPPFYYCQDDNGINIVHERTLVAFGIPLNADVSAMLTNDMEFTVSITFTLTAFSTEISVVVCIYPCYC